MVGRLIEPQYIGKSFWSKICLFKDEKGIMPWVMKYTKAVFRKISFSDSIKGTTTA